jgi:hypothetical protein
VDEVEIVRRNRKWNAYLFVLHKLELDVRTVVELGEQLCEIECLFRVDENDIDEPVVEFRVGRKLHAFCGSADVVSDAKRVFAFYGGPNAIFVYHFDYCECLFALEDLHEGSRCVTDCLTHPPEIIKQRRKKRNKKKEKEEKEQRKKKKENEGLVK